MRLLTVKVQREGWNKKRSLGGNQTSRFVALLVALAIAKPDGVRYWNWRTVLTRYFNALRGPAVLPENQRQKDFFANPQVWGLKKAKRVINLVLDSGEF